MAVLVIDSIPERVAIALVITIGAAALSMEHNTDVSVCA